MVDLNGTQKEICFSEGGETLELITQRSIGYPIIGSVQGHIGWGLEQPDLVKDFPAHVRGLELCDL